MQQLYRENNIMRLVSQALEQKLLEKKSALVQELLR